MIIGVPRERRAAEARVAASPETVRRYVGLGHQVLIERGAGLASLIADDVFAQAGATLVDEVRELWAQAEIILKVQPPTEDELALLKRGQVLIGMLDPYGNREQLKIYAERGVTAFALELLPRTTRAQVMDVLSSQANVAGYRAMLEAMTAFRRVVPMMMTAAGTIPAARVFVIGAGVAGLQAIATARRMGAVVTATDVRPAAKQEIESLGAKFVGYIPEDAATASGYARPLTPAEQEKQQQVLAEHIRTQDVVVTTAQVPGRPAPRIVTAQMVASMKPGAVILDMAVESGGNVEGSRPGETVEVHGVTILGPRNLPAAVAPSATPLYARNLFHFLELLCKPGAKAVAIDRTDDLLTATLLTADGHIVHPHFRS